ncbi:hypothetical protein BO71DRAFT_95677 [Aspergillus ellipticus CBS 707.79]|uniref:Uncharacterized protein n=1 Tax=Aspergillus ellipticus CBS 707.79 TaxID=1448320 RepID=A0A319DK63_9EURO|nr:hypothetical protein BO71DRAFT_95677 [Aspergillus ellipticus CBS 707.79]
MADHRLLMLKKMSGESVEETRRLRKSLGASLSRRARLGLCPGWRTAIHHLLHLPPSSLTMCCWHKYSSPSVFCGIIPSLHLLCQSRCITVCIHVTFFSLSTRETKQLSCR